MLPSALTPRVLEAFASVFVGPSGVEGHLGKDGFAKAEFPLSRRVADADENVRELLLQTGKTGDMVGGCAGLLALPFETFGKL